jgi:hypothetical protein
VNLDWSEMPIHQAFRADWKTPEILLEGSLGCAKTTVALDKEIDALLRWPGIPILLFRWTEDAVATKLKTAFEELLAIRDLTAEWDAKQKRYVFPNGSVAFMFGLKAVSAIEMYNKIRGLGVSRIMGDQVEEVPQSVAGELRGRLRPDLTATMSGKKFPFQLTFVANPSDDDFWLSKEFPTTRDISGRKLYSLSVFDNKHLPRETVESLLRAFPEDHPKFRTMVMGQRGPNVVGVPVFDGLYRKDIHWRGVTLRSDMPILESFEFGKHNPTWVYGQAQYSGGLSVHGGVLALGMVLEDFVPLVQQYRREWFPPGLLIKSCVAPMGEKLAATGSRYTGLDVLRKRANIIAKWRDSGNAPDVRLAMLENLSGYLRRRNAKGEESFAIGNDEEKFIIVSKDGDRKSPFVHHAFEGGATWDEHFVSVSNKELRQMRDDDKFANAVKCIENIELNFCAGTKTAEERDAALTAARVKTNQVLGNVTVRHSHPDSWMI